ncbi:MAG TPA: S1/P1 nuclease, partial [Candidatus Eisenbacteria bacterium]|nr:S1/P1 nuclease [Candidatus Eisenbacteria bacterium]
NCVTEAITRFARVLEDPAAGRDAKIEAVRLLTHFVGDVHQPLHVSFADSCGGCTVRLQTPGGKMSLHELWDTGILEQDLIRRYEAETELSDEEMMHQDVTPRWRLLARELVKETLDPDNMTSSRTATVDSVRSLNPRVWAEESFQLTRSPLFRVSGTISDAYVDEAIPIVEARLRQAGFRLAAILNEAFSGRRTFSKGTP